MDLRGVLERVMSLFRQREIDCALIGGLALAAHGAPRATVDLDLLVDGDRADEVDALLGSIGYRALYRSDPVGNYTADDPALGRIDVLFVRRRYGRAMLQRAVTLPGTSVPGVRVVDAADLIGLKLQSLSNDPARERLDLSDIDRLLRSPAAIDLERVREYFRLFERESLLEDLLARVPGR